MTNTTKILKLSSGEEIVASITFDDDGKGIKVLSPLKMHSVPKMTDRGLDEAMALMPWVHFGEDKDFNINNSNIITMTDASIGLTRFYEYCLRKLNKLDAIYEDDFLDDEYDYDEDTIPEPYTKTLH